MDNVKILADLERYHNITLECETRDNHIFTTVKCPYWARKEYEFPATHNANDFTEWDAKIYFIPIVLQMAGLKVEERLVDKYEWIDD